MLRNIVANVLFVQNLETSQAFYRDVVGLQLADSDAVSASFRLGDRYLILLKITEAANLISTDAGALQRSGGPQMLTAAEVDDVDATYADLQAKGVTLLRPPTDQPWGLRTAHIADPEGNVWEINQPIKS